VFRRFDRPDVSRSTPGNGLGLALGAAVGELHGANSRLSDNRPHGLRVVMTFGEMKRGTATTSEFAGEAYCAGNG
jgi:signal transduction histidine kinase